MRVLDVILWNLAVILLHGLGEKVHRISLLEGAEPPGAVTIQQFLRSLAASRSATVSFLQDERNKTIPVVIAQRSAIGAVQAIP